MVLIAVLATGSASVETRSTAGSSDRMALIAGLASVSASGVSRSAGSFDAMVPIAGLASSRDLRSEGSLDVKAVIPSLASVSASGDLRSEGSGAITATIAESLDDRVIARWAMATKGGWSEDNAEASGRTGPALDDSSATVAPA